MEADKLLELDRLIEKTVDGGCSTDEFIGGDDDLQVCVEMDGDDWQSTFFDELTNNPGQEEDDSEEDSDCIKSYKEAIENLEDIVLFLQHKGNTKEAMSLGTTIDDVCMCRNASTVQTTLDSFLSQR